MLDCKDYPLRADAPEIGAILQHAKNGMPDAPGALVAYFAVRMDVLQESYLFPQWSQGVSLAQDNRILALNLEAAGLWNQLAEDLTASAYHLWCDTASGLLQQPKKSRAPAIEEAQRTQIQFLAHYARLLLSQALEAKLYLVRSGFNYLFFAPGAGQRHKKDAASTFRTFVREYFATLEMWNKQLYAVTRIHYFPLDRTDVERLRVLGKQFGPGKAKDLEHGWFSQMDDAKNALWYEYNRSLKTIKRRSHEWGGYFLLVLANFFSGYGVQPWKYLTGSLTVFVAVLGLFVADDVFFRRRRAVVAP